MILGNVPKFDHMNKWYMHNSESALGNVTHKLLWDFEIQTDHQISVRRPDLIIINKKERKLAELWTLLSQQTTEKNWKNVKRGISTSILLGDWKKAVEHENDDNTNCNWCSCYSNQRISTSTGGLGNKRTSIDHPNYCITEIGQNTEKSPGDFRRLTVTQTPVRIHQPTWKTLKKRTNKNNNKHTRGPSIIFQTFFVRAILLIAHTWNSSPLPSNLLQLQCTCCTFPTTSGRSHRSPLVWACQRPSSQPLSSPQFSHNDSLWA